MGGPPNAPHPVPSLPVPSRPLPSHLFLAIFFSFDLCSRSSLHSDAACSSCPLVLKAAARIPPPPRSLPSPGTPFSLASPLAWDLAERGPGLQPQTLYGRYDLLSKVGTVCPPPSQRCEMAGTQVPPSVRPHILRRAGGPSTVPSVSPGHAPQPRGFHFPTEVETDPIPQRAHAVLGGLLCVLGSRTYYGRENAAEVSVSVSVVEAAVSKKPRQPVISFHSTEHEQWGQNSH